jgi:hypothetical protein
MLPPQIQQLIERDRRMIDELFPVGSWWLLDGKPCVAGRLRPRYAISPEAGARNVYLYAPDFHSDSYNPAAEVLPLSHMQLAAALVYLRNGKLVPLIDDDISGMSEAEQRYWRSD